MKISLFVHELLPQVGHSRAMIELLNGLTPEQKAQVESIEAVSCEAGDLDTLFPGFHCPKKFVKIPGRGFKPFILKMLSYHVFSFLYSVIFCSKKIKIGIGIACLNVDISNIQFVHEQWKSPFFSNRKMNLAALIYKKILFKYFEIGEAILFKNRQTHFIVIADFLQKFIQQRFGTQASQFTYIPSGVNTKEFSVNPDSQKETEKELLLKYPQLSVIDFNQCVPLFVGAFERKGLDRVLSLLKARPGSQLILIGKPESYSHWDFPSEIKIAHIPFTKEVQLFYAVSDLFIFPTYYEPFGLVILEAYAMGLDLIIPRDNVGASEILKEEEGIHFFHQKDNLPSVEFKKISKEMRANRVAARIKTLHPFSWEKAAQKFYSILSRY